MKIDASKSKYHERPDARDDFNEYEMKRLRIVLRRLRFLEHQVRENGGIGSESNSGGAAFAELEVEALAWILKEIEFLPEQDRAVPAVSRNTNTRGARP